MVVSLFARPSQETLLPGPRVYLRPMRRGDWQQWVALRTESRDFLKPWEPTWPPDALTRAAFRRRLQRALADWEQDSAYAFLIFRTGDDVLLGGITVANVRRGIAQMASLGYWMGKPHARQGYMTEALEQVVGYGFDDLALHRLEAVCLPINGPSQALLRRIGFRQEGLVRRYLKIDGRWQDHLMFGLLREDLLGARAAAPGV